jgi:hypothetical protein
MVHRELAVGKLNTLIFTHLSNFYEVDLEIELFLRIERCDHCSFIVHFPCNGQSSPFGWNDVHKLDEGLADGRYSISAVGIWSGNHNFIHGSILLAFFPQIGLQIVVKLVVEQIFNGEHIQELDHST